MPSPTEIREARHRADLTQSKAAALVGVQPRAWRYWEGGGRKMGVAVWELFNLKTKEKVMYKCELINDGVVVERFFREGISAESVREGLEMFQWPDGDWRISAAKDED